jgi:hypothetical protein
MKISSAEFWAGRREYDPQFAANPDGLAADVAARMDTVLGRYHEELHTSAHCRSESGATSLSREFQFDTVDTSLLPPVHADRADKNWSVVTQKVVLQQTYERQWQSVRYNVLSAWTIWFASMPASLKGRTEYDLTFYPHGPVQGVVSQVDVFAPSSPMIETPVTSFDHYNLLKLLDELEKYQTSVSQEA